MGERREGRGERREERGEGRGREGRGARRHSWMHSRLRIWLSVRPPPCIAAAAILTAKCEPRSSAFPAYIQVTSGGAAAVASCLASRADRCAASLWAIYFSNFPRLPFPPGRASFFDAAPFSLCAQLPDGM